MPTFLFPVWIAPDSHADACTFPAGPTRCDQSCRQIRSVLPPAFPSLPKVHRWQSTSPNCDSCLPLICHESYIAIAPREQTTLASKGAAFTIWPRAFLLASRKFADYTAPTICVLTNYLVEVLNESTCFASLAGSRCHRRHYCSRCSFARRHAIQAARHQSARPLSAGTLQ